jgi:hypothetical protein
LDTSAMTKTAETRENRDGVYDEPVMVGSKCI